MSDEICQCGHIQGIHEIATGKCDYWAFGSLCICNKFTPVSIPIVENSKEHEAGAL